MCSVQRIGGWLWAVALGMGLCGFPLADVSAEQVVGRVVSVAGAAYAEAPGAERRPLGCGEFVREGERVVVASDARLGVLMDEVYAQLEGGSVLRFGRTGLGAPDLSLEAGRVRVVDTRVEATSPPLRLATPDAEARGVGTDSEAYVVEEATESHSKLCEWGSQLGVTRLGDGRAPLVAKPGACAVVKPREPLSEVRALPSRIALAGADACACGSILGPVADRFSTTDVAAAPLRSGLFAPAPPSFEREPTDALGGFRDGLDVVESPGTPGGLPGM